MARHIPGMSSHVPAPELTQPGLIRQILTTPWLTLVLILSSLFLLAMMALTVWGDRGLLAMWRTQHELERLVREMEMVEQKNATLAHEVQRLRSDRGYIEKIAREELGLVRPGEIVLEFADYPPPPPPPLPTQQERRWPLLPCTRPGPDTLPRVLVRKGLSLRLSAGRIGYLRLVCQ